MFKEIFSREIGAALRAPMVYIFTFVFALMAFMAVVSDSVMIGGAIGAVHKNAPHIVTTFVTILSIFGLLFAVAFFNNAALRDFNNNFDEILFTTPLNKASYFFGRFTGALLLSTIPLVGVFLGVFLGAILAPIFDWIPAERLGATPWLAFLNNYLLFVIPNMFLSGALIYAMAQKWRSTIISFVGALMIIIGYIIAGNLLSDIENMQIAGLSDPFGIRAYSVDSRYYTTIEKNTLAPSFTGVLLLNRLLWMGIGMIVLVLSYLSFKPQKNPSAKRFGIRKKVAELAKASLKPIGPLPKVTLQYKGMGWLHFMSFFKDASRSILKNTVFKILAAFAIILLSTDLINGFEFFGLKSYPLTYKMLDAISDSSGIFMIIIMVFFSGELVWRDRSSNIDEVIGATPHRAFNQLLAQAFALVYVASLLFGIYVVAAIFAQLVQGFTDIELSLYLRQYLYGQLPMYILFACLHLFIQVVINNKYIGYFVSVLSLFVLDILWSILDVSTNMLSLGGSPSIRYSDMNSFGPGLVGHLWFSLYWFLFASFLLLVAGLLMQRHKSGNFISRLRQAKLSFRGSYAGLVSASFLAFLATAGWIYYNTQVLNTYQTSDETELLQANYEKKYKSYEVYPIPKITAIEYGIDIFPQSRDVDVMAELIVKNEGEENIDSLFFTLDNSWDTDISGKDLKEVWFDEEFRFKAFALGKTLKPGDSMTLSISNKYRTEGFENSRGSTSIIRNGTFINNGQVLPQMGYASNFELSERNVRKKYDLKPKERMPKLQDSCDEKCELNYLSSGLSDWISVKTTISTSSEQIAIAPGTLIKEWKEGERNYYEYLVAQPSQNFYAFISADFRKASRKWQGIDLEVYYDEKHPYNVERMLDAIQKSLEYYTTNFGPYFHKEARIIEFPRYATFAQAFPGTMPYSEGFGFITNLEDEEGNNVVDAVIAHEMAHQWWAHQEIPALMQGGTFLTESFSEYSSLMVMKESSDAIKMREFLKYDMDRYLRGRSGESEKELPLLKVENQGYIHYGKGSVILFALQEMIGSDSVNAALSEFLEAYRYQGPPYPNANDFMGYLRPRVPDSLQYLLTDWIENITLYDFRLKEAKLKEEGDLFSVTVDLEAFKYRADTLGTEIKVSLNEWVDIGFYADDEEKDLLEKRRVFINDSNMSYTFGLAKKPLKVAIDPQRIYIERDIKDNVKAL
jgi:ABC-2 type transport system permease protein